MASTGIVNPSPPRGARRSLVATAVAVALVAAWFCFFRLGGDRLGLDEGNYASATRNLLSSDDWLTVTPYAGHAYFQKPPLYMWLSAPLVRLMPDELWPYRAWSALLGVVAVVATALVGMRLAGRAVGVLAALLLVTNGDFLYYHGARDGTMDAALTCFTTLAVWLACARPAVTTGRWLAIGVCCGVMSMFKPFAGVPVFALVTLSTGVIGGKSGVARHAARLGLAAVALLIVAAPWYVACLFRYGTAFTDEIIGRNVVGRIVAGSSGNVQGPSFYLRAILSSSPLFVLTIPAIPFAGWVARRHDRRWLTVLAVGVGLPLLYSLSVAKVTHYIYPAYPCLALMIALLIVRGLQHLLARSGRSAWQRPALVALCVTMVVVGAIRLVRHTNGQRQYGPWELFRTLRPAIARGEVRVAFVGFPADPAEWPGRLRLEADDIFWLVDMRRHAADVETIPATTPTLVVTNRMALPASELDALIERSDERLRYEDGQIVAALTNAGGTTRPAGASADSPAVRLVNGGGRFTDTIRCEVRPPLPRRATLHVELALDEPFRDAEVTYRATVGKARVARGLASPTLAGRHISIDLNPESFPNGMSEVTIALRPADLAGQILSVRLAMEP